MGITRRRLVSLTVTLTLLTCVAGAILRPEFSPADPVFEPGAPVDDSAGSRFRPMYRTDFLNNDATHAVAIYRLNWSGLLYEDHSPQTEIPRLAEPKS